MTGPTSRTVTSTTTRKSNPVISFGCGPEIAGQGPKNLVYLRLLPELGSGYKHRSVINGFSVYGDLGAYFVPSLRLLVSLSGPLAQRILHTLSRSPRTVALAPGPAPAVPSSWRSVTFAGLRFSVPAGWRTYRTSMWLGLGGFCTAQGVALAGDVVSLTTDTRPGLSGCPAPIRQPPLRRPGNAAQVDSKLSPLTVGGTFSEHCLALHGLTACPATSPAYSILVLKVTVPGRSKPVYVSIGLAGNGVIARTILYSLKAVNGCSHGACRSSRAIPSSWVTHNSHSADELTWTQTGSQLRGVEVEQDRGITSDSVCKTQVVPNYMEYRFPFYRTDN